jgi:L-ascorbate metabolism protein UlaG (beta-lactamase superfamily)
MRIKQFGGKVTANIKEIFEASPNWKDGKFQNLEKTETAIKLSGLPGIIRKQLKGHVEGNPKNILPIIPFDENSFLKNDSSTKFTWYGHSVILMRLQNKTILIDPMLGDDASPIGPKRTKRFSSDTIELIKDLPEIDLMLITHDHYDHLDYDSIVRLKSKTKNYFVALGLKRHLISWGIDENSISEFDWWDNKSFADIQITFTPTRHFSGRGLSSMAKCLWGGWNLKTANENIWFSGDGGYGNHFVEIGERIGPIDIGFMECGQYCSDWSQIHMFPPESVQAAIDAKVKVAMPIHWSSFNLSYEHSWYEPAEKFAQFAKQNGLSTITPAMGEIFSINSITEHWWKNYLYK